MREIELPGGSVAIVDDSDHERVSQISWYTKHAPTTSYARGFLGRRPHRKHIYLHRYILGLLDSRDGLVVDHVNGNGLDNRRENLRVCSQRGNQQNRISLVGKTKFKGATFNKPRGRWVSRIRTPDGTRVYIGWFINSEDAATAYNFAAAIHHGDFAKFNEVPQPWLDEVCGHARVAIEQEFKREGWR